jgi:AcrR family transcriptional regulator
MSSRLGKSSQLDKYKRDKLVDLLFQGEAADPSAWQLFWQDVFSEAPTGEEKALENLVSVFEAGVSEITSANLETADYLVNWIRQTVRIAKSWGLDQAALSELLLTRQFSKGLEQKDSVRPQTSATREKILAAALEVFSAKGFHGTTVDEIAERAGLGKGTVYRHFRSKKGLFSELIRLKVAELEETVQGTIDPQADVLDIIETYLKVYFSFFDRNRNLYKVLIQEQSDFGAEVKALYIGNILKKVPLLKRKIFLAARSGRLKEMDFHTVFYGVMGFIDGVMQKWLASENDYSLVDEIPTVTETIFYGFVNLEPSELSRKMKSGWVGWQKESGVEVGEKP